MFLVIRSEVMVWTRNRIFFFYILWLFLMEIVCLHIYMRVVLSASTADFSLLFFFIYGVSYTWVAGLLIQIHFFFQDKEGIFY